MIVTLDELKAVLGIPLTDVSQDPYLTRLILAKTAWIEGYTQRRFDTPIPHSQIAQGTGEDAISHSVSDRVAGMWTTSFMIRHSVRCLAHQSLSRVGRCSSASVRGKC